MWTCFSVFRREKASGSSSTHSTICCAWSTWKAGRQDDPVFFGRLEEQRKEILRDAERAMDLHRARWAAEHPPSALDRLASTLKSWFSK